MFGVSNQMRLLFGASLTTAWKAPKQWGRGFVFVKRLQ